jgi:Family of unknown function (DUF6279)
MNTLLSARNDGRRAIIGVVMFALALLAGCSALKLGYRQGPALAHWWLDGYLDFDEAQSQRVKDELQRWFDWHRQTQLPAYVQHLARARGDAQQPVSGAQVCRFSDSTRDLLVPAVERLLPAAAEIVLTLRPEQLQRLDQRFAKRSAELREELLPEDPQERQRGAIERTLKRFENFYGTLSETQRKMVEDAMKASPFDAQVWFEQRERRHRELMSALGEVLRDRPPPAQVQERLRRLVQRYDGRVPLAEPQKAAALNAFNCELGARLNNGATPAQKRHFSDKLRGWEADLRALATPALSAPVVSAADAPR